mmetsp:Transcript_43121/g.107280  ORF Transcript_43121/g.107280 Transcript_43121/m.107280 type:complete len:326 (-) Transcript_43121:222-1199(-)
MFLLPLHASPPAALCAWPLHALLLPALCPTRLRARPSTVRMYDFELVIDDDDDDEAEYSFDESSANRPRGPRPAPEVKIDASPNATVASLQQQLKQLGQRHTGSKPELLERLQLIQRKQAMGLPINDMEIAADEEMQWYMLQTANGFERTVERTIRMAVQAQRLHDQIDQVFLPILEGETSVRESSVMPSYIFIRMRMNQDIHFLISSLQYVVNFVGADRGERTMSGQMQGSRGFVRPLPIKQEEFDAIVKLTKQRATSAEDDSNTPFAVGDMLAVLEGPFKGMMGPVLELNEDEQMLTLALTVMGRDSPVDIPFRHAAKAAPSS